MINQLIKSSNLIMNGVDLSGFFTSEEIDKGLMAIEE
jgi:hypothetical protein